MDINRDALLLYLRDLRDFEMARYHIGKMIEREESNYQSITAQPIRTDFWEFHPETEKEYSWSWGGAGGHFARLILSIFLMVLSVFGYVSLRDLGAVIVFPCILLALACGAGLIWSIMGIKKCLFDKPKYKKELKKTNAEIRARNQENENRVRQHNAKEQALQN
ncbi:MAG: hypothetical protein LUH45_04200, partial [Clostridiales bacterium]|nr:hypothetical protein [Clostridiales bacterium]